MTDQIQALILNPLKPYLSPITTNLPTPLNNALITLLGPQCHSALLLDLDIATHPECLTLAISKALGLAIITTASVVKVPLSEYCAPAPIDGVRKNQEKKASFCKWYANPFGPGMVCRSV